MERKSALNLEMAKQLCSDDTISVGKSLGMDTQALGNAAANRLYYAVYQAFRAHFEQAEVPLPHDPHSGREFTRWLHWAIILFLNESVGEAIPNVDTSLVRREYESLRELRDQADYFPPPVQLRRVKDKFATAERLISDIRNYG